GSRPVDGVVGVTHADDGDTAEVVERIVMTSPTSRAALIGIAVLVLVAGCSGGSSHSAPSPATVSSSSSGQGTVNVTLQLIGVSDLGVARGGDSDRARL